MLQETRDTYVVVSGPSGVGKTTAIRNVLSADFRNIGASILMPPLVSTRPPRPSDKEGEMRFISYGAFAALESADQFVVTFDKHGHRYGLRRSDIMPAAETVSGNRRVFVQCLSAKTWDLLKERLANTHDIIICRLEASLDSIHARLSGRGDNLSANEQLSRQQTARAEVPNGIDYFIDADRPPEQVRDAMFSLIRSLMPPIKFGGSLQGAAIPVIEATRPIFRKGPTPQNISKEKALDFS
jgi:guanylate kinase